METIKEDGLFKTFCDKVRKSVTPVQFQEFSNLTKNEARFLFIHNLEAVKQLKISEEFTGKCTDRAANFKQDGNLAFQKKKWEDSLHFYTESYISTPSNNGK